MPQIDFDAIAKGIALSVAAFFAWFAKRLHSKIERSVTRKELKDYMDTTRLERVRMHEESTKRIDGLTSRVDDLYRLLTGHNR